MPEWRLEPVEDIRVSPSMTLSELIDAYARMHGFMAGHLARAVDLLRRGLRESSLRVLSFTGNLVSTGLRGVLAQLVGSGLFNVVVTTTGAVDHDVARAVGGVYYKGYFEADDAELLEKGYHRLGNVFIPVESYGPKVEEFVRRLVEEAVRRGMSEAGTFEILRLAGELLEDEGSILRQAYKAGADVFVPGWPDGAFGTSLFMEAQRGNRVRIDYYRDMKRLADLFFGTKGKAAALIIGGGISKHHTIWWSQFRDGLDYVVYVTTAVEYDGSLSGAHPREAVSWGKVKPQAERVVVYADATIALPIIAAGILDARQGGSES
ncbi:deoxyhypusine synthase [Stetteria hydrogenophila]